MGINKIIREEVSDFDWIENTVSFTPDMVKKLMSNCEDIPFSNYNVRTDSPYTFRGGPNIYHMSMCNYWWDNYPNNDWLQGVDKDNTVVIIMPNGGNKDIRTGGYSNNASIISMTLEEISRQLNGFHETGNVLGEFWFLVDDNGKPKYDLIPNTLLDRVKSNYEPLLGDNKKNIRESLNGSITDNLKPGSNSIFMPNTIEEKYQFLIKLEKDGFMSKEYPSKLFKTRIRYTDWYHNEEKTQWLDRLNILHIDYTLGRGNMGKIVTGYGSGKCVGDVVRNYKDVSINAYHTLWDECKDEIKGSTFIRWDGTDMSDYFKDFGWMVDGGVNDFLNEQDDFGWADDVIPCDVHHPCVGMKWQAKAESYRWFPEIYTIERITDTHMYISWVPKGHMEPVNSYSYLLTAYFELLGRGDLRQVEDTITESGDFEWADEVTPNPIPFMFENDPRLVFIGFKGVDSVYEKSRLLKMLYSLGYEWKYDTIKPKDINDAYIWVNEDKSIFTGFPESDYYGVGQEILIDDPFVS